MCMNCGCGEYNERHKPTDITLNDLQEAARGHEMEVEQAADNIHNGARLHTGSVTAIRGLLPITEVISSFRWRTQTSPDRHGQPAAAFPS